MEFEPTLRGGQLLRQLRLSLGLLEKDLALRANLTQGSISLLEGGGDKNPSWQTILVLSKALGTSPRFWEEGSKPNQKVFPMPEALQVQKLLQSLTSAEIRTFWGFLARFGFLPPSHLVTTEPKITYLEHFPSGTSLGQRLQGIRRQLSLKQDHLSTAVTQGYLSSIENSSSKNPSIRILQSIAWGLKITLEDLLGLQEVELAPNAVRIDHFLRSPKITPKVKKEYREKLAALHKRINWSSI